MVSALLYRVVRPMRRMFSHARAQRADADNILLRLRLDGVEGVGECAPRSYVTGETPETVFDAIAALDLDDLLSAIPSDSFAAAVRAVEALDLPDKLRRGARPALAAGCCVELALLDLFAKRAGVSVRAVAPALRLAEPLLRSPGERAPLARVLDASRSPEDVFGQTSRFPVLKIKVGLDRAQDVARVKACRELGGPGLTLAVDGNMAWSLEEACEMADQLRPFSIAWYEEPLAQGALSEYRTLRAQTGVRVMLDESLCSIADARDALAADACDLWNIRVSKCGGFIASLRLAELATQHGIGFQLGTHPGAEAVLRAAEWQLAHTLGGLVAVEPVPSNRMFEEELINERLEVDFAEPGLVPLQGYGLGITLIAERMEPFAKQRAEYTGRWVRS